MLTKKVIVGVLGGVLAVSGLAVGGATTAQAAPVAVTSVAAPAAVTPAAVSSGKRNALESAKSYLEFSAFSKKGLFNQLRFEGYTKAQSRYGVNKVRTSWFKQAARMARDYLEFQSFSREGLFDQLRFEGFTKRQARWGVNKAY